MGRNVLTCLNLDGRGGWVGSIHDAIGPRLADTTVKLEIPEFVKFLNEKTRSDP